MVSSHFRNIDIPNLGNPVHENENGRAADIVHEHYISRYVPANVLRLNSASVNRRIRLQIDLLLLRPHPIAAQPPVALLTLDLHAPACNVEHWQAD